MDNYVVTEHGEILTKHEAEKLGHKVVRIPTSEEVKEHRKEALSGFNNSLKKALNFNPKKKL